MFKKIFKNTTTSTKGKERSDSYEDRSHGSTGNEGFEGRPFDINISTIWNYDHDELCEFIQKYESYTASLAAKYNELIQGHTVAKERLELLERERKRLLQENEQQKIYIDNLKQSLNEQSLSEPSSSSLRMTTTTPSEKRQIEELIKEKVKIKGIDVGLLDEVRISGENIISQLNEVRNLIQPSNQSQQESNEAQNNENENNEEKINITLKKSFKDNLTQIIEDLEMTLQLILPKFLGVNERLKQREKEIGDTLKGDFLEALRQLDEGFTDRVSSEQVTELESKANDLRHKLIKAESGLSDLGAELSAKNEQLEKARKSHEATQSELKRTQQLIDEQIEASQREIEQLTKEISILEGKLRSSEQEIKTLKSERSVSELEAEKIIENNKLLNEVSEKSDEEKNNKINELLKEKSALETEKAKLNKKISDIDQEKNDIENKLIQEKLKHHQTQSDLLKIRETFDQTQKDLNEEIESRKDDLRKIDELKKQFLESDKKSKEYKKSIKRLSQQIIDLQNKINADNKEREKEKEKELHTDISLPELTTPDRLETEPMPTNDDLQEKTQIINEQYKKIQELRDELEKALNETSNMKKEFTLMKQKKEELESQGKVLQEKREKGLQEISRLSTLIDDIKAKNPGITIPQQRPIVPAQYSQKNTVNTEPDKKTPQKGHQHSQSININRPVQKQANDYIKVMKTNLNLLYKEVILAVTNEKVLESDRGSRVSSRLDTGNSVTESSISESLVRIEKKVNDVMLLLQEYTESLE